jgi:hypothetical protein
MIRAGGAGFRYFPRELSWLTGNPDDDNYTLRREFENIAAALDQVQEAIAQAPAATPQGGQSTPPDVRQVEPNMIVEAYDFNTLVDRDGNKLAEDDPRRLKLVIPHNIPNEYYLFDIFRPYETADTKTPDEHPDGSTKGRYPIRWRFNERKSRELTVHLHRPEFGTVVVYGARTVRRGRVYQT